MKIVIATSWTIQEVDFDNPSTTQVVHADSGVYFGIDKHCGKYYFGMRNDTNGKGSGTILVCDENLKVIEELVPSFNLPDIHQIRFFNDRLFITCTLGDRILIYDPDQKNWEWWNPISTEDIPITPGHEDNLLHINTLTVYKDHLYVGCNGHQNGSLIHSFDSDLNFVKEWKIGKQIHNIFFVDDVLHVVSSEDECIRREPDEVVTVIKNVVDKGHIALNFLFAGTAPPDFTQQEEGIYPRGFIETDDSYYIGISMRCVSSQRDTGNSYIAKYDKEWILQDVIELFNTGQLSDMISLKDLTRINNQ